VNNDAKTILGIIAVIAVAVVGFMALRGTTREVVELPTIDIGSPGDTVPSGGPIATVVAKIETGGGGFLWFGGGEPSYGLQVQFFAPPSCAGVVGFDEAWPNPDPACSVAVDVTGTVTGLGVTSTGETIVTVLASVTKACFEEVPLGAFWPPESPACP
jgi:hypothetical protein